MNANRSVINVLDANTINQIAAGEVIERPASIVKELIENAIDAKATRVVVDFQEGGKRRIRVSDNGSGIVREDFSKIFLRHSTSKISAASDLHAIHSLGFRGEALASIAAIASVQLISKGTAEETGHFIQVKGGKQLEFHPAGSNQGTQIIVDDLFFNTPVRKKFLKSTQVEASRIYEVVKRTALSFPSVSFECIRDGRQIFYSSGNGKIEDILLDLQGMHYFEQLFPISRELNGVAITGYLSESNVSRGNRNHQYFFLNHRYISSKALRFALEEAYQRYLMKGRFPIAILSITIDPEKVDVNVHPTKLEVRFQEEKLIRETVLEMLRSAIDAHNQPKSWHFENETEKPESHIVKIEADQSLESQLNTHIAQYDIEENESSQMEMPVAAYAKVELDEGEVTKRNNRSERKPDQLDQSANSFRKPEKAKSWAIEEKWPAPFAYPSEMLAEIFGTYILARSVSPEALYLIDQHAAHERILYEAFLSQESEKRKADQQLLIQPEVISLNATEFELVEAFIGLFLQFGMEVEILGEQTIVVRSMPNQIKHAEPRDFFLRLLDEMNRIRSGELSRDREAAIAKAACKAAVKAGDALTKEEIEQLFVQLQACKDPFHCPHGRPTMIRLTQMELEKKFGRRT